ncbi:FAD-dependent oxidoreductase [Siphonobacter sp.]|uniref:FAD-dependent oxidoreductase n=1 Tax=Siphonobacter sp. TaxID=1869184 RepID=UPI003B3B6E74
MEASQSIQVVPHTPVAIVGGGPGGLTLARLLQAKGVEVKVYERDFSRDSRVQGAIVDLHFESGLKVLEAAGLMDAFKANYLPGADKFRLVAPDGRFYVDEHTQDSEGSFEDERFRPEISRGALRDLLLDSLLPDTVVWDSQFTSMKPSGKGWELHFKNGTTARADVVIGSDGYRSKIRPYVTDIAALYSGATIIQGEIDDPEKDCPAMNALVHNANLIAMGTGKSIAAQPRGDGGLAFYASSLYPENWLETSGIDFSNVEEVRAYLTDFYQDWNPVFHTLFEACPRFILRPLTYFPIDQDWEAKPNVTILGDAAHSMPPSGEGVNTAMLDALDLSECLTSNNFTDIPSAIAQFEQRMRARAAELAKEALEGIHDLFSPSEASIKKLIDQFNQSGN